MDIMSSVLHSQYTQRDKLCVTSLIRWMNTNLITVGNERFMNFFSEQ